MSNEAKKLTIEERLTLLEDYVKNLKVRDRGPKSSRSMTDEDAHMVKFGQLAKMDHMGCAKKLGLSYGQIYSARNGYTFNHVTK